MPIELKNKKGVFIEISTDDDNNWIYANWMGQLSEDDLKAGAMAVLELIEKTGYKRLLNNNKELIGHWNESNQWIATVWIPKAMALGFRQFAHVLSDYSYGQLSAEQMKLNVGSSFEMQLFKNMNTAKEWLMSTDF